MGWKTLIRKNPADDVSLCQINVMVIGCFLYCLLKPVSDGVNPVSRMVRITAIKFRLIRIDFQF